MSLPMVSVELYLSFFNPYVLQYACFEMYMNGISFCVFLSLLRFFANIFSLRFTSFVECSLGSSVFALVHSIV